MVELTQEKLKEFLSYNELTGFFTWLKSPARNVKSGSIAGTYNKNEYSRIRIFKKVYRVHRLIFLYMTGKLPEKGKCVDHINRNKNDNRWSNLRITNYSTNNHNSKTPTNNTSGFKGVQLCAKSNRWYSSINIKGEKIRLGIFDNFDEAVVCRKIANKKYGVYDG